jgi:hypothetical protein
MNAHALRGEGWAMAITFAAAVSTCTNHPPLGAGEALRGCSQATLGEIAPGFPVNEPTPQMRVRKRNGTWDPVDINKIVRAVQRCCRGLSQVDPVRVASRTIGGRYGGTITRELDSISIQTAASLMAEEAYVPLQPNEKGSDGPGCTTTPSRRRRCLSKLRGPDAMREQPTPLRAIVDLQA